MSPQRARVPPTTLTRVRELFDACVDLPEAARAAFLGEQTLEPDIAQLLHAMLGADARRDDLFETPAATWAASLEAAPDEIEALVGSLIGGFRLTGLLGQGGSSVVFAAERAVAGATQSVALKLMRNGLFSNQAQRRFRREQALLTQLSHPDIAHLIDAGISAAGIPYIVMERVQGVSLTEHARRHGLDATARLRLVAAVARAIDAAHRALIVHRDLKPSNVLVTSDGQVKVLDFGIAKLLGDEDETATQQIALTPGYAAPEQYRGGVLTTAVDVYALGVMASELLVGVRLGPDAQLPSTGDDADASRRRWRALDPDLATLLRAALAEDPQRRYASAQHLADDIERYLHDEPISVHPPSRRYRARKFVARHRLALALGSTALLALVVGLAIALWQRDIAQQQAARADSMRDFMFDAFADAEPSVPRDGPATVVDAVQRALAGSREETGTDPRARLELRLRLAQVLQRQGDLDGARDVLVETLDAARARWGNRDELVHDSAEQLAQNSMARGDFALARDQMDALLRDVAVSDARRVGRLAQSAVLATRVRERERAERDGREAVALARRLGDAEELRATLNDWGIVLLNIDALPEAVAVHEELLALNRRKFGAQHQKVANVQAALSRAYRRLGDLARAEAAARAAVAIDRAIYPGDDRHAAVNLNSLMMVLRARGDLVGARDAAREALRINRATLGDDHPDTVIALYGVGDIEVLREDYRAAVPPLREALARNEQRLGAGHWTTAVTRARHGYALAMNGDVAIGTVQLEQAIADLAALADPDPDKLAAAIDKRVRLALHGNDLASASHWLARLEGVGPDAPPSRANWPGNLETLRGAIALAQHEAAPALAALTRAGDAIDAASNVDPALRIERRLLLAAALRMSGDIPRAQREAAQAREQLATLAVVPSWLRRLDDALPR